MKLKTLWPKVKLLIMSNFTFGHNVFSKVVCCYCVNMRLQVGKVKYRGYTRKLIRYQYCDRGQHLILSKQMNNHRILIKLEYERD